MLIMSVTAEAMIKVAMKDIIIRQVVLYEQ